MCNECAFNFLNPLFSSQIHGGSMYLNEKRYIICEDIHDTRVKVTTAISANRQHAEVILATGATTLSNNETDLGILPTHRRLAAELMAHIFSLAQNPVFKKGRMTLIKEAYLKEGHQKTAEHGAVVQLPSHTSFNLKAVAGRAYKIFLSHAVYGTTPRTANAYNTDNYDNAMSSTCPCMEPDCGWDRLRVTKTFCETI